MDGQRARLIDRTPAPQAPSGTHLLSEGWVAVLGVGWPLTLLVMLMLQPPPDNPAAAPPLVDHLVTWGFVGMLMATSALAGARHRAAAPVSVLTGLVAVAFVVLCPVSGHHHLAPWWFAQLAAVTAMLAVSVAALRQAMRR
jgi:hypothetical protein